MLGRDALVPRLRKALQEVLRRERIEFETMTRDLYFDYLPVHRMLQDAFFADVRERGLHG